MADKFYGTGRRKNAVAKVWVKAGEGNIEVNKKSLEDYFGKKTWEMVVKQPLETTDSVASYDVIASVHGGGMSGQAGAIRHGLSKALCEANPDFRSALKAAGFLTRDPRMKERRKYGLKKARKASQFSKR